MNYDQILLESGYWEHSELGQDGDIYGFGYDTEMHKWFSYQESKRVEWEEESGIFGFFFTANPEFDLPTTWEMI